MTSTPAPRPSWVQEEEDKENALSLPRDGLWDGNVQVEELFEVVFEEVFETYSSSSPAARARRSEEEMPSCQQLEETPAEPHSCPPEALEKQDTHSRRQEVSRVTTVTQKED